MAGYNILQTINFMSELNLWFYIFFWYFVNFLLIFFTISESYLLFQNILFQHIAQHYLKKQIFFQIIVKQNFHKNFNQSVNLDKISIQ